MYELIIIGAGPCGITASVYAARKKINFLLISPDIGGQAAWSGDIENYTGYQFITGPELAKKLEEHIKQYNIPFKEGETVTSIVNADDFFTVNTDKSSYRTKTIIIASGKRSKELNIPGETEFKNKGVSYCATCDGPLFTAKDVAVIGAGNTAFEAAIQLEKIANKIFLINIGSRPTADEILQEKANKNKKLIIFNETRPIEICGEKFVSSIKINYQNSQKVLPVSGIFVEIGLIPNTNFSKNTEKNDKSEIIVDANNRTNIPGIFAAGDVTNVKEKQIIIAAGEGAKATLSVFDYLTRL
ncbi:MAG: FAD-dependent oxidoreductase [Candidatus Omnitrophica bacterium]|nr:FAD-dependent oxidoreductase [Candidatus Omnitrophota bacterium]